MAITQEELGGGGQGQQGGGIGTFQENLSFLRGEVPLASAVSGGGGQARSAAVQEQPPQTTQAQPQQAATAPAGGPSSFRFGTSGNLLQRLGQPLGEAGQSAQQRLGQAQQSFQSAAGPERTFGGLGGASIIQRAIAGDQTATAAARGLATAEYRGPTGIDTAGIETDLSQARAAARALGGGGQGLQTLIGQAIPGLTSGEARFEAQSLSQDPAFRAQARQLASPVDQAVQAITAGQEQARSLAENRRQQEQSIRDQSRSILLGQRGQVESEIAGQLAGAEAQDSKLQAAHGEFKAAPTLETLLRIGKDRLGFDPEKLKTTQSVRAGEAAKAFDAILAKYPDLKDFEPLELTVTKKGRQQQALAQEDIERLGLAESGPAKGTPSLIRFLKRGDIDIAKYEALKRRQAELEGLFSPGSARDPRVGEFSDLAPLYFSEADKPREGIFKQEPLERFFFLDPGFRPSRENVSTADQKRAINNINDILGEIDRIGDVEPFKAASIGERVDQFLKEEATALDARGQRLSKELKDWRRFVKKARSAYSDAKKRKEYGKIAGTIGGVLGATGGPGGYFAGSAVGSSIGASLA